MMHCIAEHDHRLPSNIVRSILLVVRWTGLITTRCTVKTRRVQMWFYNWWRLHVCVSCCAREPYESYRCSLDDDIYIKNTTVVVQLWTRRLRYRPTWQWLSSLHMRVESKNQDFTTVCLLEQVSFSFLIDLLRWRQRSSRIERNSHDLSQFLWTTSHNDHFRTRDSWTTCCTWCRSRH